MGALHCNLSRSFPELPCALASFEKIHFSGILRVVIRTAGQEAQQTRPQCTESGWDSVSPLSGLFAFMWLFTLVDLTLVFER